MPIIKDIKYSVSIFVTCENFEKCKNFFEARFENPICDADEAEKRGWLHEVGSPEDKYYCPDCREDMGWND